MWSGPGADRKQYDKDVWKPEKSCLYIDWSAKGQADRILLTDAMQSALEDPGRAAMGLHLGTRSCWLR